MPFQKTLSFVRVKTNILLSILKHRLADSSYHYYRRWYMSVDCYWILYSAPGGHFKVKMPSCQYSNSHHEYNKTFVRPYHLYDRIHVTEERSIYWNWAQAVNRNLWWPFVFCFLNSYHDGIQSTSKHSNHDENTHKWLMHIYAYITF